MIIKKLLKLILITSIITTTPLCAVSQTTAPAKVTTVKQYIVKHALDLGIDPALALSIAKAESGFRHEARSTHGAVGVFQLMPSTARRIGYNPYNLNENVKAGLVYYRMMYSMFGSTELALAAYNAGPGNVKRYKGVPPCAETKRFVSKIMSEYNRQKVTPDPMISQVKKNRVQNGAKNHTYNAKTQVFAPISKVQPSDLVPLPASIKVAPIKHNNVVNEEVIELIKTTSDNNLSSRVNFSNLN